MTVRKALSSYWAASHHRALGSATDDAVRLAIALSAVRSIIRVVDRTTPALTVDWAQINPDERAPVRSMSYTDLTGGTIHINPMPVLNTGIGNGEAIDVVAGFGLHEASHSQESRDRYKYLIKREDILRGSSGYGAAHRVDSTVFNKATGNPTREVPAFTPMRIAAYLWNLVEDVRIEAATSAHWPGFQPYFGAVLDYMWHEMRRYHEMPTEYGPKLVDKLRVAYIACRYPAQAASLDFNGPEMSVEREWWQAWQHDYLSDAIDTPTTIQRGLDHLAEDAGTKAELDEQARAEQAEREPGERLRAQLDRLIREGVRGSYEVCTMDGGEVVPLDAETAEAVRRLISENLVGHLTTVTAVGVGAMPVLVRKPTETRGSRRAYIGRPDAQTEALRAALVFRPSAPQHDAKLLRSGNIDDEELYRWGTGDYRVFSEHVIESKPEVFMGLLVDLSGSMYGRKLEIAQRLAQLFVWAVHDQPGIETQVWGHTANEDGPVASVYRLWERGDPLTRLGLIHDLPHANNADGMALEYVASQVALAEQPEKVVVVLSDGLPQAHGPSGGYGGRAAQQHVRAVTRWAAARGVRVVQLAIDPDGLRPEDQSAMYGAEGDGWVGFKGYSALPRQIAGLLSRYI